MTREIALLVNPTSGGGTGARQAGPVAALLRGRGLSVRELRGRDAADAATLARQAVADGVDALVVLGGDGMVHLGVQVVGGTDTPLGIVAAGTGNDVARSLGMTVGDLAAAADTVAEGAVREIDLVHAGGRYFAGVLGAGFDSVVNERANRMRWPRGRMRYNVAIAAELRTFRPIPFAIHLDGVAWETDAMLVAVANGPSYGGGMRVCPDAVLDDGLVDVMVLGAISKPAFLRIFPKVYAGRHVDHPAVQIRRAAHVRLQAEGVTAYADGERLAPLPLEMEVRPLALRVLAAAAT